MRESERGVKAIRERESEREQERAKLPADTTRLRADRQ